jgi:hypothetical protein
VIIPPTLQAILDEKLDVLTKMRKLGAEAHRLEVDLRFNNDIRSPQFGELIAVIPSGVARGTKRFG